MQHYPNPKTPGKTIPGLIAASIGAILFLILAMVWFASPAHAATNYGTVVYKITSATAINPETPVDGYYYKALSDNAGHYYLCRSTNKNFVPSTTNKLTAKITTTNTSPDLFNAGNLPISLTGYALDHNAAWILTGNNAAYRYFADQPTLANKATTIRLNNGTQITNNTKKFNLYPNWQPKRVEITFNGNGAQTNTFGNQTFTYGAGNGQTFQGTIDRPGFTMQGWATSAAGAAAGTVDYATASQMTNNQILSLVGNGNYQLKKTMTLYAVWEEIPATQSEVYAKVRYKIKPAQQVYIDPTQEIDGFYYDTLSDGHGFNPNYYLCRSTEQGFTPSPENVITTRIARSDTAAELLNAENLPFAYPEYSIDPDAAWEIALNRESCRYFADHMDSNTTTVRLNDGNQITQDRFFNVYLCWSPNTES